MMDIKFKRDDYVMRLLFMNASKDDGFNLIVVKLPSKLLESEFVYQVKDISEKNGQQTYLRVKNEHREVSIPLKYNSYQFLRTLAKINGIEIDYYDNGDNELGEGFPIKNLEDIYCIQLTFEEIWYPSLTNVSIIYAIRKSIVDKLYKLGYSSFYYNSDYVPADVLIEF